MAITSKKNLNNKKFKQTTSDVFDLHGKNYVKTDGELIIEDGVNEGGRVATVDVNGKIILTRKGEPNGLASLDSNSKLVQNIDASKINSGIIDIQRLPAGALERLIIVANQTERFLLTSTQVQEGDTVQEDDTKIMYRVVDVNNLNNSNGYREYTAGRATSVDWSGVENKPLNIINVQPDWNETNSSSDAFIKNKPVIDLNYRIYVVSTIGEFVTATQQLVNYSGEILLKNDISLVANLSSINLQNITVNGNGNRIVFNGYNITTDSTKAIFKNVTFRGTKGNVVGSDLIFTFNNGGVFLFEYCTFYNLCYNTATPTENLRFLSSCSIRIFNCQYTNEFVNPNNKLVIYISSVTANPFALLSVTDFLQRAQAEIGIIGTLPSTNIVMIDNSVNLLEGGHFVTWSDKVYVGGASLSRMNHWVGTQAQYDAIIDRDINTIYFIEEI